MLLDLFFMAAHALGAVAGGMAFYAGWLRIRMQEIRKREREILAEWRQVARQRNAKLKAWIEHAHAHSSPEKGFLHELANLSGAPEEEHQISFLHREEQVSDRLPVALALLDRKNRGFQGHVPFQEAPRGLERMQREARSLQESFEENREKRKSLENHLFSWLLRE